MSSQDQQQTCCKGLNVRMKKLVETRLLLVLLTKEKRVKWSCFQNKLLLLRECTVRHYNFLQLFYLENRE